MDRQQDFGTDPAIHGFEFGATGVAGHMDFGLTVGNHQDILLRQRILDAADGDLVAGNLLGREDDRVALRQLYRMTVERDAGQRRTHLTLAAGGDDHHLAAGQVHDIVPIDGRREILEITGRLGRADDAVERTARHAHFAPRRRGDFAQRLNARSVGGEGRDQYPSLGVCHGLHQPFAHIAFGPTGLVVEHVGAVAYQRQHAFVTNRGQFGRGRWLAQQRLFIQFPVASVENAAIRRVDQHRIAFGNRMGERDVTEAERAEIEAGFIRDDMQLDLLGEAFFLQLQADKAGREGRGIERHAQISGKIRDGADMILMPVRQDDAQQVVAPLLDEAEIGQHQFDAGIGRVAESHAEVDHDPLALAAVEIDVHADLARPAEGQEDQFILGCHYVFKLRSCISARP